VGYIASRNVMAKRKTPCPYRKSKLGHPARSLVTMLTELRQLLFLAQINVKIRFTEIITLLHFSDNSVGIALGYGLDDRDSRVRFPAGAGNFSLHNRVQNSYGAQPSLSNGY
jgi:hypothetical protein